MKTISLFLRIILIILSVSLVFYSCKKETSQDNLTEQEEEQASLTTSESEAESEIIFNEVFDNVMGVNNDVGLSGTGIFGRISTISTSTETARIMGCYIVSITHTIQGQDFPLRIEIDFGGGCPGKDGRVRSGKIITEYTGRLLVPGKSATTVFKDYTVDSVKVEGTLKITNTGSATLRQFTIEVTGGKLTSPNGNYTKWNSLKQVTQVEGMATPDLHIDDVFTVTGHASGEIKTSRFATAWESNIVEPLRIRYSSAWISKGIVKIIRRNQTADSKWAGVLNYGNGTCDNKATLLVNGVEHQIILH
jgi:hypothetical protein